MEVDWILQLVLFGVLHWILAVIVLQDLATRKRIIGGHKAPWVLLRAYFCSGTAGNRVAMINPV